MKIKVLKDMCLETPLIKDGEIKSLIIIPSGYQELGKFLQNKIKEKVGLLIPIKLDGEVKKKEYSRLNPIVLGSMLNNKIIFNLYCNHYAFVDTRYPGKGGYVVRTIHNPYGNKVNYLLLGGSNEQGTKKAVEVFINLIKPAKNLILNRIIKTSSQYNIKEKPTKEFEEKIKNEIKYRLTEGNTQIAIVPCLTSGILYYQTGDIGWSQIFKKTFFEFFEHAKAGYTPMGMAEMWAWNMIMVWDLVEESPVFNNQERLYITNKLFLLTGKATEMPYLKNLKPDGIRWNHQTFNAMTLFYGGRYFKKYYNLKEAEEWCKIADLCFKGQFKCFGSWDNAGGYSTIVPKHTLNYSLTKGDLEPFKNGNVKRMADYAIMTFDNFGKKVSFGDSGIYCRGKDISSNTLFSKAGWYYKDGRYQWMINYLGGMDFAEGKYGLKDVSFSSHSWDWYEGPFCNNIKPVKPIDMLGIKAIAPIDKKLYEVTTKDIPWEKTYDKITFRTDFNPKKQFLFLGGYSRGRHGHLDGNSIICLEDKGRILLVDRGYVEIQPKYHNTIVVLKNGKSGNFPLLTGLERIENLDEFGYTSTFLKKYNGVDWSRHIIWKKEDYFLVMDELRILEDGEYTFDCLWRTLGKIKLLGGELRIEQKGVEFFIQNPGNFISKLRKEERKQARDGYYWKDYEYANHIVQVWQQRKTQILKKGDKVSFINILYSSDKLDKRRYQIKELSSFLISLKGQDEKAYIGIRDFINEKLKIKAMMYYLSSNRLILIEGKNFFFEGEKIIKSSIPISMELNLNLKKGIIKNSELTEVKVEILDEEYKIKQGRNEVKINPKLKKILSEIYFPSISKRRIIVSPEIGEMRKDKLKKKWKVKFVGSINSIAIEDKGKIVVGCENGLISLLDQKGNKIWNYQVKDKVNDVKIEDIDKDGKVEILAGANDRYIYILNSMGKIKWRYLCANSWLGTIGWVTKIGVSDIDNDGEKEIVALTGAWWVYCWDSFGKVKWRYSAYAQAGTALAIGDIDGDGDKEVIMGNDYWHVHVISSTGKEMWRLQLSDEGFCIRCLVLEDINQDGKKEVLIGVSDGYLYVVNYQGKLIWKQNTGDEVTSICVLDTDREKRIVVGSESFDLILFDRNGKRIWRKDLGDYVIGVKKFNKNKILAATTESIFILNERGEVLSAIPVKGGITTLNIGKNKRIIVGSKSGYLSSYLYV